MAVLELELLAERASRGDPGALDALLAELQPLVVRATRLIVGAGSPLAEDAAQDALIDVTRGIRGLREPQAVRAWAMRIATSRAVKAARRERLRFGRRSDHEIESSPAHAPDLRTIGLKAEFDRLPPRMRATVVLRLYVGFSEEETAAALGCAVGTVKSQLHSARDRLRSALADTGDHEVTR